MAAILRIGDALDRGHRSKVEKLSTRKSAGQKRGKTLQVVVRSDEDISLELWTASRKADLFQQTFGLDVSITQEA
jgi:exopolyphosphatase/guanosine-5'-triphosphate,3'-diphosphate pyrophosphatase